MKSQLYGYGFVIISWGWHCHRLHIHSCIQILELILLLETKYSLPIRIVGQALQNETPARGRVLVFKMHKPPADAHRILGRVDN